MKVYTISNSRITCGAVLDNYSIGKPAEERTLRLGDYSPNGKSIPMFKNNVPVIDTNPQRSYGDVIDNAYPVKVASKAFNGYALAKPNQQSEEILVVIKTGIRSEHRRCVRVGTWSFDSNTVSTPQAIKQTIAQGSGSATFEDEIGWHDALIVMKVGDSLTICERSGVNIYVKYESVETGLVMDTQVRMILEDYDNAPDGDGLYTKLNATFPSRQEALDYRRRYLHNMYWGKIETIDGKLVQTLEERNEY